MYVDVSQLAWIKHLMDNKLIILSEHDHNHKESFMLNNRPFVRSDNVTLFGIVDLTVCDIFIGIPHLLFDESINNFSDSAGASCVFTLGLAKVAHVAESLRCFQMIIVCQCFVQFHYFRETYPKLLKLSCSLNK